MSNYGPKTILKDPRWELKSPADLEDSVLALIGLLHTGITDPDVLLPLLNIRGGTNRMNYLLHRLRTAKSRLLREWVDVGLPPGYYGMLKAGGSIVCPLCRRRINMVPCPSCSMSHLPSEDYKRAFEDSLGSFENVEFNPGLRPGTDAKFKVLCERFIKKRPLFQKADIARKADRDEPEQRRRQVEAVPSGSTLLSEARAVQIAECFIDRGIRRVELRIRECPTPIRDDG